MEYQEIALESLFLDPLNPRHDPVEGQREAIAALLDRSGAPQILRLAADIAAKGPSPIELPLVVPEGNLLIVVEGNRRIVAMKLLKNPSLADSSTIRRGFQELQSRALPVDTLGCMVASTRDEARPWIELRHNGAQQGVGVVTWSPEMQVRFTGIYSGQRGKALRITDALERAYDDDPELLDLIGAVKTGKITTFGRLVSDPDFRAAAGVEVVDDEARSHYPPSELQPLWFRVFTDLGTHLTVSSLKSKGQRADYLETLADVIPPTSGRRRLAPLGEEPDDPSATTPAPASPPTRPPVRPQRPRPLRLFHGLQLRHVNTKAKDVLREAQRMDLTQFPNAGAVLIRVLVELVVAEAATHLNITGEDRLKERIKACLSTLDPSANANRYAAIRTAVGDPNSPLSVRSMQAYLHNPYMNADAASLRAVSENYAPLLEDLDAAMANSGTP